MEVLGLVQAHLQKTPNNSGCNIQGLIFLFCKTSLEIGSSKSVHWLHSHQGFRFFVSFVLPNLAPPGSNIDHQPLCLPSRKKEGKRECTVCLFFFFSFIFISWRLITLQYCGGFCHTLTWISHGFTCIHYVSFYFWRNFPSCPAQSYSLTFHLATGAAREAGNL